MPAWDSEQSCVQRLLILDRQSELLAIRLALALALSRLFFARFAAVCVGITFLLVDEKVSLIQLIFVQALL